MSLDNADAAERYLRWRARLVAKIGRVDDALTRLEEETAPVSHSSRERVVSRRALEDLRARLSGELGRLDGQTKAKVKPAVPIPVSKVVPIVALV